MGSTFKEKIYKCQPVEKYLPIFHTTDSFGFRSIIQNMELKTNACSVFNKEKLIYTFYGKPAYRKKSELNYYDISRFPVVLMLRLPVDSEIFKIFPFDSGAFTYFEKDFKEKYFHTKNTINDFDLGNELFIIKKLINFYYGSNESYLNEDPLPKIKNIKSLDFELKSYHRLLSDQSANILDNRTKVIEISFKTCIKLTKKNLTSIFLPNEFLMDEEFTELISSRIPLERLNPYYTSNGSLDSYHTMLVNKAIYESKNEQEWNL